MKIYGKNRERRYFFEKNVKSVEKNQLRKLIHILLFIAFIVWVVQWFWWFGLSFSSSILQQPTWRLISKSLEMLIVAVPPLSGYWVVTRTMDHSVSTIRAFVVNLVLSGLPVFALWAFYGTWVCAARESGQIYISADSAMGDGIIILFCFFVFLIANLAITCFLVVYALISKNKTKGRREIKDEAYSDRY